MADLSDQELAEFEANAPNDQDVTYKFGIIKNAIRDGNFDLVSTMIDGACVSSGANLLTMLALQDKGRCEEDVSSLDPFSKLMFSLYWGTALSESLPSLTPKSTFGAMLASSPFLSDIVDDWNIGSFDGYSSDGGYLYICTYENEPDEEKNICVYMSKKGEINFDLMPLFYHSYLELEYFIDDKFEGDDDSFIKYYMSHYEYDFDPTAVQEKLQEYVSAQNV